MLLQLLVNGLISGCGYALVALGFALIYGTTKTFHFAHGAVYTLSAYFLYTFYNLWKFPLSLAIVLSLFLTAIIGILVDELIYLPLDKKGSSPLIRMLSSLGLYIIMINFVAMIYGNETKVLNPSIQPTYHIGSLILTRIQAVIFLFSVLLFILLILFLRKMKAGMMIRAARDNSRLLSVVGINPRRIRWLVFSLGSLLAGIASLLNGLDVGIDPNIGMPVFLNGAVAVIIGGVGMIEGSILGALLLGILQSLVIWKFSARWQDTMTFILLILFLLFRPQGFLGVRRRIEEAST